MSWCALSLNVRKCTIGVGLVVTGIIIGAYLNKWGYIMEHLKVEISVKDLYSSYEYNRFEHV